MIEVERSAVAFMVRSAAIEISFRHSGDRWQHTVSVAQSGKWLPLVISEEGSAAETSAAGPVYQDLRLEEISPDVAEFQLLGQSRTDIYSAAVRFDSTAGLIDFDVSARARATAAPQSTVSRYVLPEGKPPRIEQRASSVLLLTRECASVEIAPVLIPDHSPTDCRLIRDFGRIWIAAGSFGNTRSPAMPPLRTVRWRYRVCVCGHS